jgi:two-component system response regulator AlgR
MIYLSRIWSFPLTRSRFSAFMKILLVDDETLARDRLRRLLSDHVEHEVVGEASNGMQALDQSVRLNKAQLVALQSEDDSRRSHISARTYKGVELVSVQDVCFFQADHKYVTVRYVAGEVIVDETLRDLEIEFGDLFIRIHRNALVAKRYIDALIKGGDGQVRVRLKDIDMEIEVSRRHLPGIRKVIKSL